MTFFLWGRRTGHLNEAQRDPEINESTQFGLLHEVLDWPGQVVIAARDSDRLKLKSWMGEAAMFETRVMMFAGF